MKPTGTPHPNDRFAIPTIVALSIAVPIAVACLFLLPESWKLQWGSANVRSLPFFHAVLNGSTAVLLAVAYGMIKTKNVALHRLANVMAFVLSAVFLVSYVVSHLSNPDAHFGGEGWIRPLYFFILISHILLSVPVLPLAMLSIYRAWNNQIAAHKALVKWTTRSPASRRAGITIVGTEWFNWRESSMEEQLHQLLEAGAQAILLVANAPEGVVIAKNMASRDEKNRLPIFSHWGISSGDFVKGVGLDDLQKVDLSVLQTYSFLAPSNEARMQKLLEAYNNTFQQSETPETIPAPVGVIHAYDLIKMLALAIDNSSSLNRKKVRDALEQIEKYDGVFRSFTRPFSPDRHDALTLTDYSITRYNKKGYLVPAAPSYDKKSDANKKVDL